MRIIKLALTALFAVMAFGAMAASNASAAHPLFVALNGGAELSFTGHGGLSVLRAEKLSAVGEIHCELSLIKGSILNKTTLAHKVVLEFENKCLLQVPATGEHKKCTEPIKTKEIVAELGLQTATNHKVVVLLAPSDGTGEFAKIECEGNKTTIGGTIVGEIPELNANRQQQINVERTELEIIFATVNKSNQQAITEIFLLESQMTKQELIVTEFFGGKASEEGSGTLTSDGVVEIETTKP